MSQHRFNTEIAGRPVSVLTGYDRPLGHFFLVIERLDKAPEEEDAPLCSNLDAATPFPTTYDPYVSALKSFGITLPAEMIAEILQDKVDRVGNKVVIHALEAGHYVRKVMYEERGV